jgi:hypothetical protein
LKGSISLILAVITVALLAVYGFLGVDYLKQRQERQALSARITSAAGTLARVPQLPQDLEQKLMAAESALVAAQSDIPKELNSTQVVNSILKLARDCQVRAIPLETKAWAKENTKQGYYVLRLNMAISGDFSQISNFITRLEKGQFPSLVIEKLSVTRAADTTGTSMTANAGLAIYTQSAPTE